MNKKKAIFTAIDSQIKNTLIVPYLRYTNLKKENNCEECSTFCGISYDCYSCLLTNADRRNELDTIISNNSVSDIYKYNDMLKKYALKHNDAISKRVSDIIESAMYLKLL